MKIRRNYSVTSNLVVLLILIAFTSCKTKKVMNPCALDLRMGNGLSFEPKSKKIYISRFTEKKDILGKNQYSLFEIVTSINKQYHSKRLNINSNYSDYHPVFSSKGDFILFNSTRPKPNESASNGKVDMYMSFYKNGKFLEPQYLEKINTEHHDSYPSLTNTNKLYFNSDRPGGKGMMDIYVSEFKNGEWQSPKLVPEVNSEHSENDLIVDPHERFMILNRYTSETKEIDLFMSYNKNGKWSKPTLINRINKPNVWELTPTLSLDGKTLYLEIDGKLKCYRISEILNL